MYTLCVHLIALANSTNVRFVQSVTILFQDQHPYVCICHFQFLDRVPLSNDASSMCKTLQEAYSGANQCVLMLVL